MDLFKDRISNLLHKDGTVKYYRNVLTHNEANEISLRNPYDSCFHNFISIYIVSSNTPYMVSLLDSK